MSTDLVHISSNEQIMAGAEFNSSASRLFQLSPSNLQIVQKMSTAEGAIPGKLRISETGEQYDKLTVVLLKSPDEFRDYHVGAKGELNRKSENLMCFSRDMKSPHQNAKDPQAMSCATCKKADWAPWRKAKSPENIPPCDAYFKISLVDTLYKSPMNMYIRGTSKAPFEAAMKVLARQFVKIKAETGRTPTWYDVSFVIETELTKVGKPVYILKVNGSSFKPLAEADRAEFGAIFLNFANRNEPQVDAQETVIAQQQASIDDAINGADIII